ncbi:MAG: hypothetical protein WC759_00150 [Candidatus Micrarchaeia archaeon]|jgi:hypothetical protein
MAKNSASALNPFADINVLRGIFLVLFIFPTIMLLFLLYLNPLHNNLAMVYSWGFIVAVFAVILDLLVKSVSSELSEVFSTATMEFNPRKYLLQAFFPIQYIFVASLVLGLIWGAVYYQGVTREYRAFMFVPDFFSAAPTPLGSLLSAQDYDAISTSLPVATTEELFWTGVMFPTLYGMALLISAALIPRNQLLAIIIALLVAAPLNGAVAAYVFHSFAYGSIQYAYVDAWQHFTQGAFITGLTGNIMAPIIAHAIHNYAVKVTLTRGTYQALEAYFGPGAAQAPAG